MNIICRHEFPEKHGHSICIKTFSWLQFPATFHKRPKSTINLYISWFRWSHSCFKALKNLRHAGPWVFLLLDLQYRSHCLPKKLLSGRAYLKRGTTKWPHVTERSRFVVTEPATLNVFRRCPLQRCPRWRFRHVNSSTVEQLSGAEIWKACDEILVALLHEDVGLPNSARKNSHLRNRQNVHLSRPYGRLRLIGISGCARRIAESVISGSLELVSGPKKEWGSPTARIDAWHRIGQCRLLHQTRSTWKVGWNPLGNKAIPFIMILREEQFLYINS